MSLRFHYQKNHFKIRGVKNVRLWLSNVLAEEGITDFDISYFIIDDDHLKEQYIEESGLDNGEFGYEEIGGLGDTPAGSSWNPPN